MIFGANLGPTQRNSSKSIRWIFPVSANNEQRLHSLVRRQLQHCCSSIDCVGLCSLMVVSNNAERNCFTGVCPSSCCTNTTLPVSCQPPMATTALPSTTTSLTSSLSVLSSTAVTHSTATFANCSSVASCANCVLKGCQWCALDVDDGICMARNNFSLADCHAVVLSSRFCLNTTTTSAIDGVSNSGNNANVGLIVGLVVVAAFGLVLLALILFCAVRSNRTQQSAPTSPPTVMPTTVDEYVSGDVFDMQSARE